MYCIPVLLLVVCLCADVNLLNVLYCTSVGSTTVTTGKVILLVIQVSGTGSATTVPGTVGITLNIIPLLYPAIPLPISLRLRPCEGRQGR